MQRSVISAFRRLVRTEFGRRQVRFSSHNAPIRLSNQPGTTPFSEELSPEWDAGAMVREIHAELERGAHCNTELVEMAKYYFDGKGKAVRPVIAMTIARALNRHLGREDEPELISRQGKIAVICEMIHTSSLVHDDILDKARTRRGKTSINVLWDQRKSAMCGDYILAISAVMLAKLRNNEINESFAQILADLVLGELQQLQNKTSESRRFELYMSKTFNKTASLIAHGCKSNAILADAPADVVEACYQYGRNAGIAFQLVDDMLDFISSSDVLGKPAGADLKLGLSTAPVLFASKQFPEIIPMMDRRFSRPGDVEATLRAVYDSDGLDRTKELARKHGEDAINDIAILADSEYKRDLIEIIDKLLNRMK